MTINNGAPIHQLALCFIYIYIFLSPVGSEEEELEIPSIHPSLHVVSMITSEISKVPTSVLVCGY